MKQLLGIVRKDLLIEWRGKSRLVALCCYALTFLLLFSFAVGPDSVALRAQLPLRTQATAGRWPRPD